MKHIKAILIICVNTIILLFVVNIVFVYFSPALIYKLGELHIYPRKIDKCYRTFLHDDLTGERGARKVVVVGDSYSEGGGDEFLKGLDQYGIFRKLDGLDVNTDYIIAGRGGYGNISAYNEAYACLPFLSRWTSWSFDPKKLDEVVFVFYEGNDLNNNLTEMEIMNFREDLSAKRKRRILLPLFAAIRTMKEVAAVKIFKHGGSENQSSDSIVAKEVVQIGLRLTDSFFYSREAEVNRTQSDIVIPKPVQAAAPELSESEINLSLGIAGIAIEQLSDLYSGIMIKILYLPSVASSYGFDKIRYTAYDGSIGVIEGESNDRRSSLIRDNLRRSCDSVERCEFCDATPLIRAHTKSGVAVHGPLDWSHFNAQGYELAAKALRDCTK